MKFQFRYKLIALTAFLFLTGMCCLLLSILGEERRWSHLTVKFLEAFGVTLLSVVLVKLIYDIWFAKEHLEEFDAAVEDKLDNFKGFAEGYLKKFHSSVKDDLANFQNLTGNIVGLGIIEVFPDRSSAKQYNIAERLKTIPNGSTIRFTGTSLWYLMNKTEVLIEALRKDCKIELCFLDEETLSDSIVKELTYLRQGDMDAISTAKDFLSKLPSLNLPGSFEIRFHKILLFDSLRSIRANGEVMEIRWELNFGREEQDKRVFIVDPNKQLGSDLFKRYDGIWQEATEGGIYPPKDNAKGDMI